MYSTCWNIWHVAYKSKHVPFSLDIIFQFKAKINNSRDNKALHETPSAHGRVTQHRRNIVWMVWKTPRSAVSHCVPPPLSTVAHCGDSTKSVYKKSCAVNISTGLFYIALGMEFEVEGRRGDQKCTQYASWPLLLHIKSHVVFACGSIEYFLETVATSEDVLCWSQ